MSKDLHRFLRRLILLLLLLLVLGLCILQPVWLKTIIVLLLKGNITNITAYIRSFHGYAMLVSFCIVVLINISAVLPNIFMLATNGVVFGVWKGTLISWLAESAGVTISFLLMRYLLHDYAHEVISRSQGLKTIDKFSGKNGLWIMMAARAIPFIPSGLLSALGAVSSISIRDYIIATLIGKFPSSLIEVMLGHDLVGYRKHELRLTILILISVASYGLFAAYRKRQQI